MLPKKFNVSSNFNGSLSKRSPLRRISSMTHLARLYWRSAMWMAWRPYAEFISWISMPFERSSRRWRSTMSKTFSSFSFAASRSRLAEATRASSPRTSGIRNFALSSIRLSCHVLISSSRAAWARSVSSSRVAWRAAWARCCEVSWRLARCEHPASRNGVGWHLFFCFLLLKKKNFLLVTWIYSFISNRRISNTSSSSPDHRTVVAKSNLPHDSFFF